MTTATTWNPSDKSAVVTLSGSDLVATGNAASPEGGVRSTSHYNAGKYYFEFNNVNVSGGVADSGVGICTAAAVLATMGGSAALAALVYNTGNLWVNGGLNTSNAVPIAQTPIGVAVDLDNGKLWVWEGTKWNNNVIGSQNPANNTGGSVLTGFLTTGVTECYIAMTVDHVGPTATINPGTSAFAYTPPSGFAPWYAPATPLIDGNVNALSTNAATTTAVLTTTQTDDIIIAIVDIHSNQAGVTVSGVTCDGVSMTQRQYLQTLASDNIPLIHSVWYLHVSAPLVAKNIVASYTNFGANTWQNLTAFGVYGCDLSAPFDTDASLPAHSEVNNSTRTTHPVTWATVAAKTFVFATLTMDTNFSGLAADTAQGFVKLYDTSANFSQASFSEVGRFTSAQVSGSQNVYAADNYNIGSISVVDALKMPVNLIIAPRSFASLIG